MTEDNFKWSRMSDSTAMRPLIFSPPWRGSRKNSDGRVLLIWSTLPKQISYLYVQWPWPQISSYHRNIAHHFTHLPHRPLPHPSSAGGNPVAADSNVALFGCCSEQHAWSSVRWIQPIMCHFWCSVNASLYVLSALSKWRARVQDTSKNSRSLLLAFIITCILGSIVMVRNA